MRTLHAAVAKILFEQVVWPLQMEQNAGGPALAARVPEDCDDILLFFMVASLLSVSALSWTVVAEEAGFLTAYHVPVLI
jgi:hypothetical protein